MKPKVASKPASKPSLRLASFASSSRKSRCITTEVPHCFPKRLRIKPSSRQNVARGCYPSLSILDRLCPYKLFGGAALFRCEDVAAILDERMGQVLHRLDDKCELVLNKNDSGSNSGFVSWKRLRHALSQMHDEAIRRMLCHFPDPFVDSSQPYNGSKRNKKSGSSSVFEKNYLTLANVNVPFSVVHNKVYLDVLQSFTLLGLLKVALTSKWAEVDAVLQESGLAPQDAFRGLRHFSHNKSHRSSFETLTRSSGSQQHRSHVSLKALIALAQSGTLVHNALNRRQLALVLTDIDQQLQDMNEQRQTVEASFQKAVEDIFASGHYMTRAERRPSCETRSSAKEKREDKESQSCETLTSQGEETATTSQDESSMDQSQDEEDNGDRHDESEDNQEELHLSSRVRLLDTSVFFQFANDKVYLDRKAIVRQITQDGDDSRKVLLAMDKALRAEKFDLKEAFLFEGRRKGYVSLQAIRALLESKNLKTNKRSCLVLVPEEKQKNILDALSSIEKDLAMLQSDRELQLKSFNGSIRFHKTNTNVYLQTMQVLQALEFESQKLSKAYYTLGKALQRRGRKLDRCFLSSKSSSYFSKYSFMSLEAVAVLLNMDSGPFAVSRNVDTESFRSDLISALEERGLDASSLKSIKEETASNPAVTTSSKKRRGVKHLKLNDSWPLIEYKLFVMNGHTRLFLRRQSLFNLVVHLEPLMLASCKSDEEFPIRQILSRCGLKRMQEEFLADEKETYAFISMRSALCLMTESLDPRLVCLEREAVGEALIDFVQAQVIANAKGNIKSNLSLSDHHIDLFFLSSSRGKSIFFNRDQVFLLSGLNRNVEINKDPMAPLLLRGLFLRDCFRKSHEDDTAGNQENGATGNGVKNRFSEADFSLISLSALLTLLNLEGGIARGEDLEHVLKTDLIKAVLFEGPRLATFRRKRWFHQALIHSLLSQVALGLAEEENLPIKSFELEMPKEDNEDECKGETNVDGDEEEKDESDDNDPHWLNTPEDVEPAFTTFTKLYDWVSESSNEGSHVGEWKVVSLTPSLVHLHLPASKSGGSRKLSFMHPDTSALISYRLIAQKGHLPTLFVNRLPIVVDGIVHRVMEDKEKSGIFKLLYELLVLRPCFGCYAPEMVETATKMCGEKAEGKLTVKESASKTNTEETITSGHNGELVKNGDAIAVNIDGESISVTNGHDKPEVTNENGETVVTKTNGKVTDKELEDAPLSTNGHVSKIEDAKDFFVDTAFLGFSASGRHFKGTVRSKQCEVVTNERVSDTCAACNLMREMFVVDRSVLRTDGKNGDTKKQSVWKVEQTSQDACVFLCPQLQCFDTLLPREEKRTAVSALSSTMLTSSSLATSVVEYRVRVADDLSVSVTLNNHEVASNEKKCKLLGPLLDRIASEVRLCVGYPDKRFVSLTSYLLENLDSLQPEVSKIFSCLIVDKSFKWSHGVLNAAHEESAMIGTVRLKSCTYRALDDDDRCAQCRLLQRRVDSLNI